MKKEVKKPKELEEKKEFKVEDLEERLELAAWNDVCGTNSCC